MPYLKIAHRYSTDPHPNWLVAAINLASGASNTLFLRGDMVWALPLAGGFAPSQRAPAENLSLLANECAYVAEFLEIAAGKSVDLAATAVLEIT